MSEYDGELLCKGSVSIGTGCGKCSRCLNETADIELGKNLLAGPISIICCVAIEEILAMEPSTYMDLLHVMQARCRNLVKTFSPMREWGDSKGA